MGKAVQLRGTPTIMKAFDRIGIANWALIYDRKILFKCAGEELSESRGILEGFLKQLEISRTSATYELWLYEEIKDKKKIRIATEPDYAYNIEIFDAEDYPAPGSLARREGYARLEQRLDDITAQLAIRQKEEEEEDDQETEVGAAPTLQNKLMQFLDKLLDNPKVQDKIGSMASDWMDRIFAPQQMMPMQPQREIGAIGGTGSETPGQPMVTEEQALKIQQSVQILAAIDDKLGDHLEQIAKVAESNPKKYHSMITMLNTFL